MTGTSVNIPSNWQRFVYGDGSFVAGPTRESCAEACFQYLTTIGLGIPRQYMSHLHAVVGGGGTTPTAFKKPAPRAKTKTPARILSAAARKKISARMKERWRVARTAAAAKGRTATHA